MLQTSRDRFLHAPHTNLRLIRVENILNLVDFENKIQRGLELGYTTLHKILLLIRHMKNNLIPSGDNFENLKIFLQNWQNNECPKTDWN